MTISKASGILVVAVVAMATALAPSGSPARADDPDELMPGKLMLLKTGTLAKAIFKPATSFDLPDLANDPTIEGAALQIVDSLGGAVPSQNYALPAGGWKGLGNPPG